MDPLSAISAALTSLRTATEIAKLMSASTQQLELAEMKLKLAEVVTALADAKIQVVEVKEAIQDKDKTIKTLEEQLKMKEEMEWEKPYWWKKRGDSYDGPFCSQCWDKDKLAIHLKDLGFGQHRCSNCQTIYQNTAGNIATVMKLRLPDVD
jgi:hypothetical protein